MMGVVLKSSLDEGEKYICEPPTCPGTLLTRRVVKIVRDKTIKYPIVPPRRRIMVATVTYKNPIVATSLVQIAFRRFLTACSSIYFLARMAVRF